MLFSQSVFKCVSGLHVPSKPLSYNTFNSSLVKATDALRGLILAVLLGLKNFSGFLKRQVVDYAGRIGLFYQVSFEAGN